MNLKKLAVNPYTYILFLTYFGVWLGWDALRIPFSNPLGIISHLSSIGYNPNSNLLRFVAAVFGPPLACLAYWWVSSGRHVKLVGRYKWVGPAWKGGLILLPVMLAVFIGTLQASTGLFTNIFNGTHGGPYDHSLIDTFHEGETLGMATSYQDPSKKPYRDFVFVHGVFQDPLRTVLAFKVFHESIGSSRAFVTILSIITFLLYYVLLLVIFRRNLIKAAFGMVVLSLLLAPSNALPHAPSSTLPFIGHYLVGIHLPIRDITTLLFLIFAIIGLRAGLAAQYRKLSISSFLIGFIMVISFANSIDRAIYTLVLSIFWLGMLLVGMKARKRFWRDSLLWYGLGSLAAFPLLGAALKWAFGDFFAFIMSISGHKEFLDGIIFKRPGVMISGVLIGLSIALTICGALFLKEFQNTKKKKSQWQTLLLVSQRFITEYYLFILLLATALIYMRSAIGRAEVNHFAYSVPWLYLLVTIGLTGLLFRSKLPRYLPTFIVVMLLGATSLHFAVHIKRTDIRKDAFPLGVSDKQLVRTDHWETAEFLKQNLHGDETFVTLTSEASWYYLVKKPSPVKYPIVWFAFMPEERKELASSIDNNHNIKYILTNNNWTNAIDYIPNEQRFPEVYDVLNKKYERHQGFGQQTVWKRKP